MMYFVYLVVAIASLAFGWWVAPKAINWYLNDQAEMRDQQEELEARRKARIEMRMREYLDEERF